VKRVVVRLARPRYGARLAREPEVCGVPRATLHPDTLGATDVVACTRARRAYDT